jgi:hypothetical protein
MPWQTLLRRRSVTGVEARQGFLDRPVLVVLIVSLLVVAVLFGVMLLRV